VKNLAKPMAAHAQGHRHFDTCRLRSDGILILGYEYGAGDKVTASVEPTDSAVVVSLHVEVASGVHPAIALHGELRFDAFGGLRSRPVKDLDGTVLPCPENT
jgi:hypothetical protein